MASSLRDPRYRKIIGKLREARLAAGFTQIEVARQLGRPQSFMAKVEAYERRLDVLECLLIAHFIGLSFADIWDQFDE